MIIFSVSINWGLCAFPVIVADSVIAHSGYHGLQLSRTASKRCFYTSSDLVSVSSVFVVAVNTQSGTCRARIESSITINKESAAGVEKMIYISRIYLLFSCSTSLAWPVPLLHASSAAGSRSYPRHAVTFHFSSSIRRSHYGNSCCFTSLANDQVQSTLTFVRQSLSLVMVIPRKRGDAVRALIFEDNWV